MSVRSNEVTERRALVPQRACAGRGRRNGIDLLYVYRGQRSDARVPMCLAASAHHLSRGIAHDPNGNGILFVFTFNVTCTNARSKQIALFSLSAYVVTNAHLRRTTGGSGCAESYRILKNLVMSARNVAQHGTFVIAHQRTSTSYS